MAGDKEKKAGAKKAGRGVKLPSKRSINLLILEKNTTKNLAAILAFVVFMAAVGVFVKFMVVDQINQINRMEVRYRQQEDELAALKESNAVYEQVRAEHSHYGNSYMNDEELMLQDRLDMLDVIEEELLNQDALQSIVINGNVAQLKINSSKLRNVSEIVASLEDCRNVEYVTVTNSVTDEIETVVTNYDEMYEELYNALYESLNEDDEDITEALTEQPEKPAVGMDPEKAAGIANMLGSIFGGGSANTAQETGPASTAAGTAVNTSPGTSVAGQTKAAGTAEQVSAQSGSSTASSAQGSAQTGTAPASERNNTQTGTAPASERNNTQTGTAPASERSNTQTGAAIVSEQNDTQTRAAAEVSGGAKEDGGQAGGSILDALQVSEDFGTSDTEPSTRAQIRYPDEDDDPDEIGDRLDPEQVITPLGWYRVEHLRPARAADGGNTGNGDGPSEAEEEEFSGAAGEPAGIEPVSEKTTNSQEKAGTETAAAGEAGSGIGAVLADTALTDSRTAADAEYTGGTTGQTETSPGTVSAPQSAGTVSASQTGTADGTGTSSVPETVTQTETESETSSESAASASTSPLQTAAQQNLAGLSAILSQGAQSMAEAAAQTPETDPVTIQEKMVVTTMTIYFKSAVQLAQEAEEEGLTEESTEKAAEGSTETGEAASAEKSREKGLAEDNSEKAPREDAKEKGNEKISGDTKASGKEVE